MNINKLKLVFDMITGGVVTAPTEYPTIATHAGGPASRLPRAVMPDSRSTHSQLQVLKMIVPLFVVVFFVLLADSPAQAALRFEAEDWTRPQDAWQVNSYSENKWNLWSNDRDAATKWSGGTVLQSPSVVVDRESAEDGAPVLHTVITGIPEGMYNVYLGPTGRLLAVSFDGATWQRATQGTLLRNHVIGPDGKFELWVDDRFAIEDVEKRGASYYDYIEFQPPEMEQLRQQLGGGDKVEGHVQSRRAEKLDRGLIALRTPTGVYLSWRLLADDPGDLGFDLFRVQPDGSIKKLNHLPLRRTTDFFDEEAPATASVTYQLLDARATVSTEAMAVPYLSIKLHDPNAIIQRVAVVDLNGDGRFDYIIKTPRGSIDPAPHYWKPSPGSYAFEAYLDDGTFLWRYEPGWAIEQGIWYSPFVAWDITGNGSAEFITKIGEGDPRDEDGRVTSGPEWLAVFDGFTGEELARTPWPDRTGFGERNNYNLASRNQLAIAYLDGKTPNIIALRGTYGRMKAEAYEFHQGKLRQIWSYDNEKLPRHYQGQGAHSTWCFDADGDGRDEILLGSVMLDDTGIPLWSIGLGHPDMVHVGDHNPARPGLEIFLGVESRASRNGLCMVDPATGDILWGIDEPTNHIHGHGFCADIDPIIPGNECFGLDLLSKPSMASRGPWLWGAAGELLWFEDQSLPKVFGLDTLYWDADLQKEIFYKEKISKYRGQTLVDGIKGSVIAIADVLGDWREELLTSVPGEMRIYSTTHPANDRRICLLQDRLYRSRTILNTSGYQMVPNLSYQPASLWPNLIVTVEEDQTGTEIAQIVLSAPLVAALQGELTVFANGDQHPQMTWPIDLTPNNQVVLFSPIESTAAGHLVEFSGKAYYTTSLFPGGMPVVPDFNELPETFSQSPEFSIRLQAQPRHDPARHGNIEPGSLTDP